MSVSRDDVIFAYRLLLGRNPESEPAIAEHMKSDGLAELRERFIRSGEFQRKNLQIHEKNHFLPLDLPKLEVDTDASSDQISLIVAKIKSAWEHLGVLRPHYSVLTNPQYLPENLEGSIDTFWKSGEAEAASVQRMLERYMVQPLHDKICVEYGCGVGRVSMGLARRFATVHAYDISYGHLAHAEQRARVIGITNLQFHQCSDTIVEDLHTCDVFYSSIVFQHNPPPIITQLIKKALRSLNSGGIAIFQVPTYARGYRFNTSEWLNLDHVLDMQMHCLPQKRIFEIVAEERCVLLDVREDNRTGAPESFISNTFVVRKKSQRVLNKLTWLVSRLNRK